MKFISGYLLLWLFIIMWGCPATDQPGKTEKASPNVIFIMADDIGQGDIGFYHRQRTGSDTAVIPTPHLDRLIASGIRFDDAHTQSALCSPTRYTVMTGNYTFRSYRPWGVWGACAPSAMGKDQKTVGHQMKRAGYKTAFFGKWHLGGDWLVKGTDSIYRGAGTGDETTDFTRMVGGSPHHSGFDYSFTIPSGIQNNPFAFYENAIWYKLSENSEFIINPKLHGGFHERDHPRFADSHWETSDVGRLLTEKARSFIREQVAGHPDQPFFMYYCSQAVHVPHEPPQNFFGEEVANTSVTAHGDMIRELDLQVGQLMEALEDEGIAEQTLIIFSSDNGGLNQQETEAYGHDSSNGFRGSKTWIYEGGHRVPFIASWPGHIRPGSVSKAPIMVHDLAATLHALTGQDMVPGQAMDSYNLLPLLLQRPDAKGREVILSQGSGNRGKVAIRKDGWKLIIQSERDHPEMRQPVELYNLMNNITEQAEQNLIDDPDHQEKIRDLMTLYHQIRDSESATTPRWTGTEN